VFHHKACLPVGKGSSLSRGDAIGTETDLEANRLVMRPTALLHVVIVTRSG